MSKFNPALARPLPRGNQMRDALALFLAGLTLSPCAPAFARGSSKDARRTAQIKAAILKLGVGKDARVMVTLRDKQRVKGYVAQAANDSFLIGKFYATDVARVRYDSVKSLRGINVATGKHVSTAIGVGGRIKGAMLAAAGSLAPPLRRPSRWTSNDTYTVVAGVILLVMLIVSLHALGERN